MSVISGIYSANKAESIGANQSDAIIRAAQISADTQLEMFDKGAALTEPWRVAGAEALDTLSNKIAEGPGEFNFEQREGEVFARDEGLKARERTAAARGGLMSGAALKEAERFASGFGAQRYDKQKGNFLREYYESLTPLQSLAGVGQSTASQTAGNAATVGANVGNTQFQGGVGAANAVAAGQTNATNAITGTVQATTNNALVGYNAWKNMSTAPSYAQYSNPSTYDNPVAGTGPGA